MGRRSRASPFSLNMTWKLQSVAKISKAAIACRLAGQDQSGGGLPGLRAGGTETSLSLSIARSLSVKETQGFVLARTSARIPFQVIGSCCQAVRQAPAKCPP